MKDPNPLPFGALWPAYPGPCCSVTSPFPFSPSAQEAPRPVLLLGGGTSLGGVWLGGMHLCTPSATWGGLLCHCFLLDPPPGLKPATCQYMPMSVVNKIISKWVWQSCSWPGMQRMNLHKWCVNDSCFFVVWNGNLAALFTRILKYYAVRQQMS